MIFDELQPFAISLIVGLITGIERERSSLEGERTMGVRTFSLIALTGAAAAVIDNIAISAGLTLGTAALVVVGYLNANRVACSTEKNHNVSHNGLTTECAALLVFALGFLSKANPIITIVVGIILVTVLYSRSGLHDFSKKILKPEEIRAALILAIFAFIIMPFIPDRTCDPWGLVNPKRLFQIMTMIAGLEFGGYVVERIAGPRVGLLATGFFGGLASSTAVYLNLTKMVKSRPEARSSLIGAGLMATSATTLLFVAIILVSAPDLGFSVGLPAFICGLTAAFIGLRVSKRGTYFADKNEDSRSPLDLAAAAKLGLFIFGLLMVSAFVKRTLGAEALMVVSFVGGLFELHSVTYANAALFISETLSAQEATVTLLVALVASFISKIAICFVLAFGRFALEMAIYLLVALAAGAATYMLIV